MVPILQVVRFRKRPPAPGERGHCLPSSFHDLADHPDSPKTRHARQITAASGVWRAFAGSTPPRLRPISGKYVQGLRCHPLLAPGRLLPPVRLRGPVNRQKKYRC